MKVLHLIIAIYVLAITVYPCSDNDTCADEIRSGIAIGDHDNTDTAEQDVCSPFCACSCCATHGQLKSVSYMDVQRPDHNTPVPTFYLEKPVFGRGNSIWQPPRV